MAVRLLLGPAGSPGATTTAIGLTLHLPAPALLVDAARDAAQAPLAGYLRGAVATASGLEEFARRRRMGTPFDLDAATVALDEEGGRRFLPGLGHLAAVDLFEPTWPALAEFLRSLADAGTEVVVDGGRLTSIRPVEPLLRVADEVLVVTRTSLRHLAAARPVCEAVDDMLQRSLRATHAALVLIGEGMPYDRQEVVAQFGWPVDLVLPHLSEHAAVFSDGAPAPRRWERSPLLEGFREFVALHEPTEVSR